MLRVVVDTNVVVSAALFADSTPARCARHILRHGRMIVSEDILEEYIEVLSRPRLRRYIEEDLRDSLLESIAINSDLIEPGNPARLCRDPRDDKFLAAAIQGNASCLLTGDSDLLELNGIQGLQILDPATFLAVVGD